MIKDCFDNDDASDLNLITLQKSTCTPLIKIIMDFMSRNFDLPENIFYFFNLNLDPLSFVLNWDTSDKFYFNLLNRYFANVLDKPNKHSMVLAKPNDSTYFHNIIPAFDVQYIEHCFDLKDFPDPTEYVIKNSCPVTYTKQDIVDCWIHQTKSWSDLIHVQNDEDHENEKKMNLTISSNEKKYYVLDSDSDKCTYSNPNFNCEVSSSTLSKRKSRIPYSHNEDIEIVKYIIKNNYALKITGNKMWQNMERDNICKIRTWQSMKERYMKHIKYDLTAENYKLKFLSKSDMTLLRKGLKY